MFDQPPIPLRWDIFCRVVDNFGDAGVCWRLAADLARRGLEVRLYIDQPAVLATLIGDSNHTLPVSIRQWPDDQQNFAQSEIAEVVIEAFACDPPAAYVSAMARSNKPPVWINLEYLSAEAWVEANHGLPSPHPRYALTKYFYFPGFTPSTGGLLREQGLIEALDAESTDINGKPLKIFVFGYFQPRISEWLDAITALESPTLLNIAPCPAQQQVSEWQSHHAETNALTIAYQPLVPQIEFDRLLAKHDFLFIRGEDSFVRAQWVAKPLVWQIYPQEENAHLVKLQAFYDRYLNQGILTDEQRSMYWQFVSAWNDRRETDPKKILACTWPMLVNIYPLLLENAHVWRNQLLKQRGLVSQLRDFVGHLVK